MPAIAATVVLLHVAGWGGVWLLAGGASPTLIGLATLAYSFGLRHAFDADHIAAIDNTTRRLMAAGRPQPLNVGLLFSLGHSTVVLAMTAAIAFFTNATTAAWPELRTAGQTIGTTISGVFLYVIGALNLVVLVDVLRVFRQVREGRLDAREMDARLMGGGPIGRWCRGLFRLIERPWQMYLVGALFGLGFDTATEIGLLTTAAIAASQTLPIAAVLCLPMVFAAGMTLMDAANGVVMCRMYAWTLTSGMRRIAYNLVLTGVSVLVALVVGTIELVSLLAH